MIVKIFYKKYLSSKEPQLMLECDLYVCDFDFFQDLIHLSKSYQQLTKRPASPMKDLNTTH